MEEIHEIDPIADTVLTLKNPGAAFAIWEAGEFPEPTLARDVTENGGLKNGEGESVSMKKSYDEQVAYEQHFIGLSKSQRRKLEKKIREAARVSYACLDTSEEPKLKPFRQNQI